METNMEDQAKDTIDKALTKSVERITNKTQIKKSPHPNQMLSSGNLDCVSVTQAKT